MARSRARPVLILTSASRRAGDPAVDRVARAIEARGKRAVLLDSERFPFAAPFTLGFADREAHTLEVDGERLPLDAFDAVWVRHTEPGEGLPRDLDPQHREGAQTLADFALFAALECFPPSTLVIDRYESLLALPRKARQLQLARELGIEVPRTLITNHAASVRAFARACRRTGVIVKMIESGAVMVAGEDGDEPIYTRTLEPGEDLTGLDLSPMIFQERVPKKKELRVTVVGRRVFTASVDPKASTLGADDWRRDRALVGAFQRDTLPRGLSARLLRLLDRLGLNFATIDLIVTPDDRHVFLEVNAISYFGFIERSTGLPISDAVADLLVGRAPPRIGRLRYARPRPVAG
jgi:glutathione synthase/RimK-type ligase-like ATP-grasp enzyme